MVFCGHYIIYQNLQVARANLVLETGAEMFLVRVTDRGAVILMKGGVLPKSKFREALGYFGGLIP